MTWEGPLVNGFLDVIVLVPMHFQGSQRLQYVAIRDPPEILFAHARFWRAITSTWLVMQRFRAACSRR
jgi:hypothetical protein